MLRRVYQSLFLDIFSDYVHSLDLDEIQEMDEDIRSKGWGVKILLKNENSYELLSIFQMFYYQNGRLPLTNGLLFVPDGDVPEGRDKINLKHLNEMLRNTNSHGIVSVPFLCVLGIFVWLEAVIGRITITGLYRNLSYETLSGARGFDFEAISDVITKLMFVIKGSILDNIDRRLREDQTSEEK